MFWIILLLFVMLILSMLEFFHYAIKYTKGVNDESTKSPLVAIYYDRMFILGIATVLLVILIGVLL